MSSETLARSFEPFFTTKPVGEGTGLGLSMVYGVVKQHGGHIWVRSTPGEGTTMELCWPLTNDDLPMYSEVRAAAGPARGAGGGRVVLVADDEPLVRMLAVRALNEDGYTAVAAEDGFRCCSFRATPAPTPSFSGWCRPAPLSSRSPLLPRH